jgi:hypothetical protein
MSSQCLRIKDTMQRRAPEFSAWQIASMFNALAKLGLRDPELAQRLCAEAMNKRYDTHRFCWRAGKS